MGVKHAKYEKYESVKLNAVLKTFQVSKTWKVYARPETALNVLVKKI